MPTYDIDIDDYGILFGGTQVSDTADIDDYGILFGGTQVSDTVEITGGIVFSGTQTSDTVAIDEYGILFGDTAEITTGLIPNGGIVFGSGASISWVHTEAVSGGIEFGGAGLVGIGQEPQGGIEFGGNVEPNDPIEPEGGLDFGGEATVAIGIEPSGGIVFGSGATVSSEWLVSPTGGIVFGTAPYDTGYYWRVVITVPAGQVLSDLSRFPLPVKVALDPSHVAGEEDILFTDSDDNPLAYDVVHYSTGSGTLHAYVKTDLEAAADNTIYLYYGVA